MTVCAMAHLTAMIAMIVEPHLAAVPSGRGYSATPLLQEEMLSKCEGRFHGHSQWLEFHEYDWHSTLR
eukprot:Skav214485  [mRNA]  locus=scaffold1011:47448:48223:+ [translate_table: standard]